MIDRTGNLPPLSRNLSRLWLANRAGGPDGRELLLARWGMPSPVFAPKGKKTGSWRNQHSQRQIPSLAATVGTGKPMPGADYQLL
jgi:hypothetical protein